MQDCENISLKCDKKWMSEAITNILKNCMEHSPAGGSIAIQALQTPIFTELTVTDSGPGLDPEELPRLFERFYRGKDAAANSIGIGLALARQIVTAQNGTLQAANASEGGARFTMRFYMGAV